MWEANISPIWYAVDLGLIGVCLSAAHVAAVRETRAQRVSTQNVRDKVQRVFDGGACQSYELMDAIGKRLADILGTHGGTHQFTMAQLDRTLHDASRAYLQLGDSISDSGSGSAQLQNELAEFCRRYSELVLLLGDVTQQSGHDIAHDEWFRSWMKYDRSFTREMNRLAADPEFQPFARSVRGFFAEDGFAASHSLKAVVSRGEGENALHAAVERPDESVVPIRMSDRNGHREVQESRAV